MRHFTLMLFIALLIPTNAMPASTPPAATTTNNAPVTMREASQTEIDNTYGAIYNSCIQNASEKLTDLIPDKTKRDTYVNTTCQCGADKLKAQFPSKNVAYLNDYYSQKIATNDKNKATYERIITAIYRPRPNNR